jgi:hypothetical protein
MLITPNPKCKSCHGSGTIYDTVDYGLTTAQLSSFCGCVEEQIPEDYDGEIEIDYEEYYANNRDDSPAVGNPSSFYFGY